MNRLDPTVHKVLIVDDEQDMIAVTKLGLKGLSYGGKKLEFLDVDTGAATVQALRDDPSIAVILLDVVMEDNHAGLDACKAIREELGNHTVRILLRTGQPGAAPEKETIDAYDIDGYLPKAELTTNRLYTAVRTALKAWEELVELERHRAVLTEIHQLALSLHSYDSLDSSLNRLASAAVAICPVAMAVLQVEVIDAGGDSTTHLIYPNTNDDAVAARAAADEVVRQIAGLPQTTTATAPSQVGDGVYVPISIHHGLGRGWLFLSGCDLDDLTGKALALLAAHAGNALYSTIAQRNLEARDENVFDETGV